MDDETHTHTHDSDIVEGGVVTGDDVDDGDDGGDNGHDDDYWLPAWKVDCVSNTGSKVADRLKKDNSKSRETKEYFKTKILSKLGAPTFHNYQC